MKRILAWALVVAAVLVPVASAHADLIGDVKLANNIFISLDRIDDAAGGDSVWVYRVREQNKAADLEWWLLEVKDCVTVTGLDGGEWVSSGTVQGVRWTVSEAFDSGYFALGVKGRPAAVAVAVQAAAGQVAQSEVDGPGCQAAPSPTQTAAPTLTSAPTKIPTPTITPIPNRAPSAGDTQITTRQDTPVEVNVLALASDPDGDRLSLSAFQAVSDQNGTVTRLENGTPSDRGDDRLRYSPPTGFTGTDRFTYTASDGDLADQGRVTIVVQPPDVVQTPTGRPDQYSLLSGPLTVPAPGVLSNDDTAGLAVTVELASGVTNGSIILGMNGGFTYTPLPGFQGEDSFTYRLVYGSNRTGPVRVTLTVSDAVAPVVRWVQPVTDEQRFDVAPGQNVSLRVDVTDNTPGAVVTFQRWDAPNNRYLDLGVISTTPYQLVVPASTFNEGWNQVNAEAVDPAGNVSNSPYIWIFRSNGAAQVLNFHVFLPRMAR